MIQKLSVPKRLEPNFDPYHLGFSGPIWIIHYKMVICFCWSTAKTRALRLVWRTQEISPYESWDDLRDKYELILEQRIQQAHQLRTRFSPLDTNCFRLLNGEGDGPSGIIVDVYDSTIVLRLYSKCWLPYVESIVNILGNCPTSLVYIRNLESETWMDVKEA